MKSLKLIKKNVSVRNVFVLFVLASIILGLLLVACKDINGPSLNESKTKKENQTKEENQTIEEKQLGNRNSTSPEIIKFTLPVKRIDPIIEDVPYSSLGFFVDYIKIKPINESDIQEILVNGSYSFLEEPVIKRVEDGVVIALMIEKTSEASVDKITTNGYKPFIFKIDFQGNILWELEYDYLVNYGRIHYLSLFDDGQIGVMISSYIDDPFGYYSGGQCEYLLLDANGDLILREDYGENSGEVFKYGFVTKDEQMITIGEGVGVNGNYTVSSEGKKMIASLLNKEGKVLLQKAYGSLEHQYCQGAVFDDEIGLVFSGWTNGLRGDFVVEEQSSDRVWYDFVASINPSLDLVWVVNPKNHERYNYSQLIIKNQNIYIPGSKNIVEVISDKELGAVRQISFWQKIDKNGKTLIKKYEEESMVGSVFLSVLDDGRIILASGNGNSGWISSYRQDGTKLNQVNDLVSSPSQMISFGDSFVIKAIRSIKTIPQPIYMSSIWMDTEVVMVCFDKELEIKWLKVYDDYLDETRIDPVYLLK